MHNCNRKYILRSVSILKNSKKVQTSVIYYAENSVLDDRLDIKISYMNRVSCCLHNNMFSIA